MSDKERDIWDDLFQSRLKDFEADTDPGDWEAIADRLPGKAPVPLRRTWRYWAAAAVIALSLVPAGKFLYDRYGEGRKETPPIAREISWPSLEEEGKEPLIPGKFLPDRTSVLASTEGKSVRKTERAVSALSVKISPVSDRSMFSEDENIPLEKIKDSDEIRIEVPRAEKGIRVPVSVRNRTFIADAAPVTRREPARINTRKWGFGMGGGGMSIGADNLVPQYVTNSSVLKSENLTSLNALDASMADPAETDIRHKTPIGFGVSVSRYLNERLSLQTGLTYSFLRSEWSTNNTYHIDNDQRLHFLGIPLSVVYKIAEWNRFMFYASAGGMAEVNVAGKRRMKLYSDDVEILRQSERVRMKEWLWSVNARVGVSYPIIRFVSAFGEVGASYYFDNGSAIETIHSEKPFNVNLQFGFRFGF